MPMLTGSLPEDGFNGERPPYHNPEQNSGESTGNLVRIFNYSNSMSVLEVPLFDELMNLIGNPSSGKKYKISLIPGNNRHFQDDLNYSDFEEKLENFMESGENNMISIKYRMQLLSEKGWDCSYDEENEILKISPKSDDNKGLEE